MTRAAVNAPDLLNGNSADHAPVPVEHIVTAGGVQIARNHYDGPQACFALNQGGHRIIGVNTTTSPRRQRFAIAHAYGHLVLHSDRELTTCWSVCTDPPRPGSSEPDTAIEAEANVFAAELLMPERLLRAAVDRQVTTGGHASKDALIAALAREFEVSNEAMGWRLISLAVMTG